MPIWLWKGTCVEALLVDAQVLAGTCFRERLEIAGS